MLCVVTSFPSCLKLHAHRQELGKSSAASWLDGHMTLRGILAAHSQNGVLNSPLEGLKTALLMRHSARDANGLAVTTHSELGKAAFI